MLDAILSRLRDQPSRTGSLIITLYGDAIAPRGGSLWLGSLLALFRAIGVADGVVRTAASRLAGDGWLDRSRIGRNSFYRLTPRALRDTEDAAPRIYGALERPWDGHVHLVLLEPGSERDALRATLAQAGHAAVLPGLLVAPDAAAMPPGGDAIRMVARLDPAEGLRLARRAWPLDELAARYRSFTDMFPAGRLPQDPLEALVARMVLIHEWRRVVLRDPRLPAALLPPDWPGHAARRLAAGLHQGLYESSERWLDAHGVTEGGGLPPAQGSRRRFA